VRTLWRILLAAAALVAVALGFVAWKCLWPRPSDFTGLDRIALSDTRLGDPTSASASLKDASLVERCRRCRPFGDAYSDVEIAAAANDVTARFGAVGSRLTAENVASLRLTR
jgi:hypothetical protein